MTLMPIPGFPGYFAGDDGNVYSIKPRRRCNKPPESPRKLVTNVHDGYRKISLTNARGKLVTKKVSYFILIAFVGPRPEGMQICHGPKGCLEDSLLNLRWDTLRANFVDDKIRDGKLYSGERHPRAKLTDVEIQEVVSLKGKVSQAEIAERFGIHQGTVSAYHRGKGRAVNAQ